MILASFYEWRIIAISLCMLDLVPSYNHVRKISQCCLRTSNSTNSSSILSHTTCECVILSMRPLIAR